MIDNQNKTPKQKTKRKDFAPVTGLTAGGDEFVWIEHHDFVFVRLVHQYAVHGWRVRRHHSEAVPYQAEDGLH